MSLSQISSRSPVLALGRLEFRRALATDLVLFLVDFIPPVGTLTKRPNTASTLEHPSRRETVAFRADLLSIVTMGGFLLVAGVAGVGDPDLDRSSSDEHLFLQGTC